MKMKLNLYNYMLQTILQMNKEMLQWQRLMMQNDNHKSQMKKMQYFLLNYNQTSQN